MSTDLGAGGTDDSPVLDELPVYVIHWESVDKCVASIASIKRSTGLRPVPHVVENSADQGFGIRKSLGDSTPIVVAGSNLGYAGGANLAIGHWRRNFPDAKYIAITSHDVSLEPDTLWSLVRAMEEGPEIGLIGPRIEGIPPCGTWNKYRPRLAAPDTSGPIADADWISGTCLLLRREALLEVGPFETRFGSYVEDVDLGLRLKDSGWRVCVALEALASQSGSTSTRVTFLVDRNAMYLAAKRGGLRGVTRPAALLVWYTLRGFIAAISPGRSRERRRQSIQHSLDHLRALVSVALHPRLLRSYTRAEPTDQAGDPEPSLLHAET